MANKEQITLNAGGARVTLTKGQEFQLMRLMDSVITLDNNRVVYADGWDDERVMKEAQAIAPVKIDTVVRLRKQAWGALKRNMDGNSPIVVLHNRVADLLRRVEALEALVTKPHGEGP